MRAQADTIEDDASGAGHWIPITMSVVALLAIPVATYFVIVNGWAAALTGTVYTQAEHQADLDAAHDAGFAAGRSHGFETGFEAGEASGFEDGHTAGERAGYDLGFIEGEESGTSAGFDKGHARGYSVGQGAGFDRGQSEGYEEGLVDGYGHGFVEGCLVLFESLDTDRVGSWWDYYYSPTYAYYYEPAACASSLYWPLTLDSDG
jgi:hypothetical protein